MQAQGQDDTAVSHICIFLLGAVWAPWALAMADLGAMTATKEEE